MADIKFRGFVQKHDGNRPWEITEGHSKKDNADKWVTVARTFHKVWLKRDAEPLNEGDLVEVTGQQKTVASERDGKKYFNLVIYAETVNVIKASGHTPATTTPEPWPTPQQPVVDAWAVNDDQMPF